MVRKEQLVVKKLLGNIQTNLEIAADGVYLDKVRIKVSGEEKDK